MSFSVSNILSVLTKIRDDLHYAYIETITGSEDEIKITIKDSSEESKVVTIYKHGVYGERNKIKATKTEEF